MVLQTEMDYMMQIFKANLSDNKAYSVSDVPELSQSILKNCPSTDVKRINYIECPCSFDLEASSFYTFTGEKAATMYVWSMGLFGRVVVGRTWSEFMTALGYLSSALRLSTERRLILGVQNLDYDFQFFRKYLDWYKVFSIDDRKPVYAIADIGVEFRCTYKLSGYSLATIGNNLQHFEVKKMVGDLDYSLPRHSGTPLTEEEMGYVLGDAKVVMAYLAERMIEDGSITKIPLTKTGYVRRMVRERCFRFFQSIKGCL